MRTSRILFWILTCSLGFSILSLMAIGLLAWYEWLERAYAITWLFNGHLATAAVAMSAYERNRARTLTLLGIVASPVGFLLWSLLVALGDAVAFIGKWGTAFATPFTALAVYAALVAALMHLPRAASAALWLRRIVFAIAAVAAVHGTTAVVVYPFRSFAGRQAMDYIETNWRWIGIYLVLIMYLTLAAAAALYLRRLFPGDRPLVEPIPVRIICPRCERDQEIGTEGDTCASCGLRIKIALP